MGQTCRRYAGLCFDFGIVDLGKPTYGTEREAEIGGVAHEVDGAAEKVDQTDTGGADEQGGHLVAHHAGEHRKHLHAAEKAGRFKELAIVGHGVGSGWSDERLSRRF